MPDVSRDTILEFLSRRRQGGASLRDLTHSMMVAPHQRRHVKRLLRELTRDGLVKMGGGGKFQLTSATEAVPNNGGNANTFRNPGGGDADRPDRALRAGRGSAPGPYQGKRPHGGDRPQQGGDRNQGRNQKQRGNRPPQGERPATRFQRPPQTGRPPAPGAPAVFTLDEFESPQGGGSRPPVSGRPSHGANRPPPPQPQRGVRPSAPPAAGFRPPNVRPPKHMDHSAPTVPGVITGRFTRNPEGYGFVSPLDKQGPDVFIPPDAIGSALHGDIVDARVVSTDQGGARRAGRIIGVRERSRAGVPGRFEQRGKNWIVVPDDKRMSGEIFIARGDSMNAKENDLVLAEITAPPQRDFLAKGKVVQVLGDREDPGIDSDLVIGEFGIQVEFSPGALAEAGAFPETIPDEERRKRRDLTHVPFVTIDGITAKDFDDAVAVESLPNGRTRLYVAIADVASYVRPGTQLDDDASARATSVYLPDRVVPMLPERLSNDLCSLKPDEDRLALCAAMDIDAEGEVREYAIDRVVFRSRQRMTYDDVHGILIDKKPHLLDRYKDQLADFEKMHELMGRLRKRRFDHGSIDFDLPEPTIVIDLTGATTDIIKAPRYVSHRIVEEFMLLANVTVAKHFASMDVPLVYRVHDAPDPSKLEAFNEILGAYGVKLHENDLESPRAVGKALARFDGKPEERVVHSLMLRAMRQASYSVDNIGHFGLAFPWYAHFTSPIRRYPDLLVHRAVHAMLDGRQALQRYIAEAPEVLPPLALHSSRQERVAMEAERAIIAIKKVRFMRDKVGEIYAGHITGVAKFGLFVELDEIFVEGLVRMDSIGKDDQYEYDEARHRIVGRRSGRAFRLGDPVSVEVVNASLERRALDFRLARKIT